MRLFVLFLPCLLLFMPVTLTWADAQSSTEDDDLCAVVMASTMLAGCEGLWDEEEIQETYDDIEANDRRDDDFGGGGEGDCFTGNEQQREASCGILDGWSRNSDIPDARRACISC